LLPRRAEQGALKKLTSAARALFQKAPDPKLLAAWGLLPEDVEVAVEVWEEAFPSFAVFEAMRTQWRVGAAGATGLDYGVLPFMLEMQHVDRAEWPTVTADVRLMEGAALDEMHKDRNVGA